MLEIVLQQESAADAEQILSMAESGIITLAFPAFSLVEPGWEVAHRGTMRRALCASLANEVRSLQRTSAYEPMVQSIGPMIGMLQAVEGSETTALDSITQRLLAAGRCIPIDAQVMSRAATLQPLFDLSRQDALILASILLDLEEQDTDQQKWFISRDRKDFSDPAIVGDLGRWKCRLLTKFIDGVRVARRPER